MDETTNLIVSKGFRLESRHVDFFITFTLLTKGAVWQLASLVGHEVAALTEGQVFQVQKLPRHHGLLRGRKIAMNQRRCPQCWLDVYIHLCLHQLEAKTTVKDHPSSLTQQNKGLVDGTRAALIIILQIDYSDN